MSFGKVGPRPEGRRFGRRETSFTGWIRLPGWSSRVCTVRNVSIGGALLECEHPMTLPFKFELHIPIVNTTYACEARHRSANTIGVEFVAAQPNDAPSRKRPDHEENWTHPARSESRRVRDVRKALAAMKVPGTR